MQLRHSIPHRSSARSLCCCTKPALPDACPCDTVDGWSERGPYRGKSVVDGADAGARRREQPVRQPGDLRLPGPATYRTEDDSGLGRSALAGTARTGSRRWHPRQCGIDIRRTEQTTRGKTLGLVAGAQQRVRSSAHSIISNRRPKGLAGRIDLGTGASLWRWATWICAVPWGSGASGGRHSPTGSPNSHVVLHGRDRAAGMTAPCRWPSSGFAVICAWPTIRPWRGDGCARHHRACVYPRTG